MTSRNDRIVETFDRLSRTQLEIYAAELQQSTANERRLRAELEARNAELEQKVREVTALNRMFHAHLNSGLAITEAYREVLDELTRLSGEVRSLTEWAQAQPIPDVSKLPEIDPNP